jgi:antibiotic biosynthesis monooxygenase (ABM) superfamily enzyme
MSSREKTTSSAVSGSARWLHAHFHLAHPPKEEANISRLKIPLLTNMLIRLLTCLLTHLMTCLMTRLITRLMTCLLTRLMIRLLTRLLQPSGFQEKV